MIVFLPADLESDPEEDIPKLLGKLDEGYDVVAGWRQGRKEGKVFASGIYNRVSKTLFHIDLHDMNWIKAFRREVIESLPPLRSDWHRFILQIAAHQGFRIGEVPTTWYRRQAGQSKFGFGRIPISLLDVLVVWFLLTFSQAPMRFFGGIGLACLGITGVTYAILLALYLIDQTQKRPIFIGASVLALAGLLLLLVGFIAELIVSQGDQIRELEHEVREGNRSRGMVNCELSVTNCQCRLRKISRAPLATDIDTSAFTTPPLPHAHRRPHPQLPPLPRRLQRQFRGRAERRVGAPGQRRHRACPLGCGLPTATWPIADRSPPSALHPPPSTSSPLALRPARRLASPGLHAHHGGRRANAPRDLFAGAVVFRRGRCSDAALVPAKSPRRDPRALALAQRLLRRGRQPAAGHPAGRLHPRLRCAGGRAKPAVPRHDPLHARSGRPDHRQQPRAARCRSARARRGRGPFRPDHLRRRSQRPAP